MTEPTDNLQQRCAEIVEWQRTGVLSGSTLRNHAKTHWAGCHDSLQMAERDTFTKAVEWVAKWGASPAVAREPVSWMGTHDKTDLYYRKPTQADVVPLYDHPQPTTQAAPAPLSDDTERLEWLLWKLPGDALRYVVGELADTSSGAEFRAAIDAAMKAGGAA